MTDPEISTADALRLLSAPPELGARDVTVDGPRGWSRRRFLQAVGLGIGAGLSLDSLGSLLFDGAVPDAWAGAPIGANDGILVNLMFFGGNDGINTVVPFTDPKYATLRQPGGVRLDPSTLLPISGNLALHPSLAFMKALFDAGQVAVLQGVGYPNPDLSHFSSMAIWMNGRFGGGPRSSGWLGRWLDEQPAATALFAAATVGSSVPLHLIGESRRALGVPENGGMFGSDTDPAFVRSYAGLSAMGAAPAGRGQWHDAYASTMRTALDVAGELAPAFTPEIGGGEFVRKLTMAARLINRNVGLRVVDVGVGGFDHHDGEPYRHMQLMADLDAGLSAFYATLDPAFRGRVAMLTSSEFGRTPGSNSSGGTDHGTLNTHFLIGANVRGGIYGSPPALGSIASQWQRLDFTAASIDFRSMYATVLDGWLGGGGSTIVNGAFDRLDLFRAGPGTAVAPRPGIPPVLPPAPPGAPSQLFTLSPQRLIDTRFGIGGRSTPLGPGETWTVPIAGKAGVPGDAVAVALNVTSDQATSPTFLTVWAAGTGRPSTSNLNPTPERAVPNMVIAQLGNGAINVYNLKGAVAVIIDVVGYFKPGSAVGLVPMQPVRLLDTREGLGVAARGKAGPGAVLDLQITGVAGVQPGATAVALNVTATQPDQPSFLSVYPSGEALPQTSSVNMVAGQTVPNMVMAKLGANGRVSIYNLKGNTHVVVDLLGCFQTGASGKFVSLAPVRLLDTRDGTGAPKARIGRTPLRLPVLGQRGVPAKSVGAVLLNVTAVEPTRDTFVTVFPGDATLPNASNVNVLAGEIAPNMVLARLGAGGDINFANYDGDVDLVADLVGYFTA